MTYADPTTTLYMLPTIPYENLLPSPTPLATLVFTPVEFVSGSDVKDVAYLAINTCRWANQDKLLDLIGSIGLGALGFVGLMKIIERLRNPEGQ